MLNWCPQYIPVSRPDVYVTIWVKVKKSYSTHNFVNNLPNLINWYLATLPWSKLGMFVTVSEHGAFYDRSYFGRIRIPQAVLFSLILALFIAYRLVKIIRVKCLHIHYILNGHARVLWHTYLCYFMEFKGIHWCQRELNWWQWNHSGSIICTRKSSLVFIEEIHQ